MNIPSHLKYVSSHEWVRADDGEIITVGISDYAQHQLGELVYVELPELGRVCEKGEEVAVVESTESAGDIYAPVSGEIVEVNDDLTDDPAKVNGSPFEDGWLFRMKISDATELDGLLDAAGYQSSIE